MVVTTALEIEIHFVTSQTVLAWGGSRRAAMVAGFVARGGVAGIETTTKPRLFIAQWVPSFEAVCSPQSLSMNPRELLSNSTEVCATQIRRAD